MSRGNESAAPPLIAHVIHHLAIGGLENGLVNLLDHLAPHRYRHVVVCMTGHDEEFRARIRNPDVRVFDVHKRQGNDPAAQWRVFRLLRRLRPQIVHTRNLTAMDALLPAVLAGAPLRIHGEHGWDPADPDGKSRKRIWLRRAHRPFVHRYVAVSQHLERYLRERVGVPAARIERIYNGVDTDKFRPARSRAESLAATRFGDEECVVVGTVGRLNAIKDQRGLIDACAHVNAADPTLGERLRLVLIGDGELRGDLEAQAAAAGLAERCWFAGARHDIPALMRGLDVFVLPSLAEGISNTILEAMASGVPVIATAVGGNGELVVPGETGDLVARSAPAELVAAIRRYAETRELRLRHGAAGRERACRQFSLATMVQRYSALYDSALESRRSMRPES